jgi:hypothetical protein
LPAGGPPAVDARGETEPERFYGKSMTAKIFDTAKMTDEQIESHLNDDPGSDSSDAAGSSISRPLSRSRCASDSPLPRKNLSAARRA